MDEKNNDPIPVLLVLMASGAELLHGFCNDLKSLPCNDFHQILPKRWMTKMYIVLVLDSKIQLSQIPRNSFQLEARICHENFKIIEPLFLFKNLFVYNHSIDSSSIE